MNVYAFIEQPAPESLQDALSLRVEGWFYGGAQHEAIIAIEIYLAGQLSGRTEILYGRKDVEDALGLAPGSPTGFALLISAPSLLGQSSVLFECCALLRGGVRLSGPKLEISFVAHDYRADPYGPVIRSEVTQLFHRSDIYQTGPSVLEVSSECLGLVLRYLGPPPKLVLDVGCGLGGYGKALLCKGYDWVGVEKNAADCVELARSNLPHEKVDGQTLPFEAHSFDDALCIEVLEHVASPSAFLCEIRRVIRRRLLVSVPNLELLPYMHHIGAVPWHLLEGDHRNFFSRTNLRCLLSRHFCRVEVLSYGMHKIRSAEGLPLFSHLFAVCDSE
jgi:SAM-dependent methyltransferase